VESSSGGSDVKDVVDKETIQSLEKEISRLCIKREYLKEAEVQKASSSKDIY
jgi:hypothetical protein